VQRVPGFTAFFGRSPQLLPVEGQVGDDLFQFAVSWRRDRNSRRSDRHSPANCFFQRWNVCSLMPGRRQTSVHFLAALDLVHGANDLFVDALCGASSASPWRDVPALLKKSQIASFHLSAYRFSGFGSAE
jgi:hypothetical protein